MYSIGDITQLHIETSTRCNAECPMCCRNVASRTSPGLVEQSMSLATFTAAAPDGLLSALRILDICGAYGDPAMTPELIQIVEHVRDRNPDCAIRVFSNGGLRDTRWWRRLGEIDGVTTVFAIDGVATNDVYRRKVQLDKVLENAAAFISAGGIAQWDYLVFEHNEHEIDQARELSKTMGFETFSVKRSARFLRPLYDPTPEMSGQLSIESFPIHDKSGSTIGELRPPRAREYVNDMLVWMRGVADKVDYLESFFDSCEVRCTALDSSSLFLSVEGHAYPCCWTYVQATLPTVYKGAVEADTQVSDLLARCGGPNAIDATRWPLANIVDGEFFAEVERSWSSKSVRDGKLKVCARVCGAGFNAYRKQFDSAKVIP